MTIYNNRLERNTPLKRSQIQRSGKPINKNGRRGKDWLKTRRQLSVEYAAQGITSCELRYEGCWGDKALGYAHGRKRRHLKGDELKTLTILACNPCHDRIEYLPPEEMLRIVQGTIANRRSQHNVR